MSERTFFTLRYALPGYTFILVLLLVAYPRLKFLFSIGNTTPTNVTMVSAFLAFFTLLSGAAIGFLVSQFWYTVHNSLLHGFFLRDARKFLEKEYNLTKNVHHQIVFLDHVHHLSGKEMVAYTQRRFDLKHTLASTLSAVFIGTLFGILVRVEFLTTGITLEKAIHSLGSVSVNLNILSLTMYDLGVIIIIAILSIILFVSFRFISKEHAMMVYVSVRKLVKSEIFPYSEARAIFPEDYFDKKWK